jgi:hypothetical protein
VKYANATAKVVGTVAFAYAAYINEQTERTKTKNMRCSLSEVYTQSINVCAGSQTDTSVTSIQSFKSNAVLKLKISPLKRKFI